MHSRDLNHLSIRSVIFRRDYSQLYHRIDVARKSTAAYAPRDARFLPNTFDFTEWFKPHLNNFDGFASSAAQQTGGMHQFDFTLDTDGAAVMHYRQSSQATTWLPDGQGLRIFSTTPTGRPDATPFRDPKSWKKEMVVANCTRWMPYVLTSVLEHQHQFALDWRDFW